MIRIQPPARLVVLISGRGSNMLSILAAIEAGELDAKIVAVISNRHDAAGLGSASKAGIATQVLDHHAYPSREAFDMALAECVDSYQPDLVILAGFMRILTAHFVAPFAKKLLNIHPSLLPKFKGLDTHQRAINAKETEHGATVHFVTTELDDGPIVLQAKVPVLPNDTASTLAQRVLQQEHRLYPDAIRHIIEQRSH